MLHLNRTHRTHHATEPAYVHIYVYVHICVLTTYQISLPEKKHAFLNPVYILLCLSPLAGNHHDDIYMYVEL